MLSQKVNLPSFHQTCSIFKNFGNLQEKARVEMQTCLTWEFRVGPRQSWLSVCKGRLGGVGERKKGGREKEELLWFYDGADIIILWSKAS